MAHNTNQHFVPKLYLKRFVSPDSSKNQLWGFEKKKKKPFLTDIGNIGAERYFYNFPLEIVDEENVEILDQFLQKHESEASPFSDKFEKRLIDVLGSSNFCLEKYNDKVITEQEKFFWSEILSIQALRTPKFREFLKKIKKQAESQNIVQDSIAQESAKQIQENQRKFPDLCQDELQNIQNFTINTALYIVEQLYTDEYIPLQQGKFIIEFNKLSQMLLKHIWIVGINQTDIPFYTSDHPLATIPYFETGYESKGVQILYPVNSSTILILKEKTHFNFDQRKDCKLVNLTEDEVLEYNKAQIYCSDRFIYCQENNFDLARKICQEKY